MRALLLCGSLCCLLAWATGLGRPEPVQAWGGASTLAPSDTMLRALAVRFGVEADTVAIFEDLSLPVLPDTEEVRQQPVAAPPEVAAADTTDTLAAPVVAAAETTQTTPARTEVQQPSRGVVMAFSIGSLLLMGLLFFAMHLAKRRSEEEAQQRVVAEAEQEEERMAPNAHMAEMPTLQPLPMPAGQLEIGYTQHIGKRPEQQDAFGFSDPNAANAETTGFLAIVADGMGGMQLGAEASSVAVQQFIDVYDAEVSQCGIDAALEKAAHEANTAVREMAEAQQLGNYVGTTLVATVVKEDQLHLLSVGDSRIYHYRRGVLTPLTEDHIYLRYLAHEVARGTITQEQALSHPERDALTSYLGIDKLHEIEQPPAPLTLEPGDRVLLCSDGLYGPLDDEELIDPLEATPQEAADMLLQSVLAKKLGYQDNATLVVLGYEPAA